MAYFTNGRQVVSLDLHTLEESTLFEVQGRYKAGSLSCTADGSVLCISVQEDLSDRICHEGPWDLVDHRIWCLDLQSDKPWKIRPDHDNVFVGHEYWHADGVRIGYHGYTESLHNKDGKFIGSILFDNTAPFIPKRCMFTRFRSENRVEKKDFYP